MSEVLTRTEEMNELLDRYEKLLTDRQRDVMNLYYREDLSYQEIADDLVISKSAIYDIIKRVSQNLHDYESKLHLVQKHRRIQELMKNLYACQIDEVNQLLREFEEETYD